MMSRMLKTPMNSPKLKGFTLVEVMVVIVIVGIMAGLITLAIGDNHQDVLKRESQRLYQVLRIVSDESAFQGREMGLLLQETGYSILAYDHRARAHGKRWMIRS